MNYILNSIYKRILPLGYKYSLTDTANQKSTFLISNHVLLYHQKQIWETILKQ